jgi:spermidine synthase
VTRWVTLATARTAEGDELLFRERDGEFELRMNGRELMASRAHGSEEAMARLACRDLPDDARILLGGLGMGYTLRAALDVLPRSARVLVIELLPEVAGWNRGRLAPLTGFPLADPRVELRIGDVRDALDDGGGFDAILLDIDNGPDAPVRPQNGMLFGLAGLRRIKRALRPGGRLAVWSADPSAAFERNLDAAGYTTRLIDSPAYGEDGPPHRIYLATGDRPHVPLSHHALRPQ